MGNNPLLHGETADGFISTFDAAAVRGYARCDHRLSEAAALTLLALRS
jgi:hypothetical protein